MNKKIFTLLFLLFAITFSYVSAENRHKQKGKKKDKSAKVSHKKEHEKSVTSFKIDTLKVKIRNLITEIDSVNNDKTLVLELYKKDAHASYYANKFSGRRTASGKNFDNNKYTAAHKKLPFGTLVKVTNEVNGKSVIVEITDRGPFSKVREIDLSKRAFMDIVDNKNSGVIIVKLEVVE